MVASSEPSVTSIPGNLMPLFWSLWARTTSMMHRYTDRWSSLTHKNKHIKFKKLISVVEEVKHIRKVINLQNEYISLNPEIPNTKFFKDAPSQWLLRRAIHYYRDSSYNVIGNILTCILSLARYSQNTHLWYQGVCYEMAWVTNARSYTHTASPWPQKHELNKGGTTRHTK